ncbi:MAG: hypothetical protein AAF941_04695 [Pseudomonadota bacterium]
MFEKAIPISEDQARALDPDSIPGDMLIGSRDRVPGKGGDAVRAVEWNELTARLNAARDLRRVLRRDARINIEGTAASFGDAAATYFQSLEQGERPVNPVALEASKASPGITNEPQGDAETGDARDD